VKEQRDMHGVNMAILLSLISYRLPAL